MEIDKAEVKNILIFKLCCLGDIVLLTPVINSLKEKFPDSKITLLISSWVKDLVKYLKNIDSIIINDDLFKKKKYEKLLGVLKLIVTLRKNSFDLVFLGHRNSLFGLIVRLAGIRYRLGFSQTKFLNYTEPFDENIHESRRYLNVLKSIDINVNEPQLQLVQIKSLDEIKKNYNIPVGKFIIGIFPFGGINPGTEMDIKRWNLENYFSLVKQITDIYPDLVMLLFEGSFAFEKINEVNFSNNVMQFKIDIDLISVCNLYLSNDTGAMHIAAGFNIQTLSIFGPTNPKLLAPLNLEERKNLIHEYIWKKPECSPCYTPQTSIDTSNEKYWRDGKFICYTGTHICMKEITVEEVYKNLFEMINRLKH